MKNIKDLFDLDRIDPSAKREFAADALDCHSDTQAEDALDRIFELRQAVAERFGQSAMYDHTFYETPYFESKGIAPDFQKTLLTPYEMAHRSGEGLKIALQHLRQL